jgi:hypothetical protein
MSAIGPLADVLVMTIDGAPSNGATGAGVLPPGSLLIDYTNGNVYINTGTKASPTFSVVSLSALSAGELGYLDGLTPGTQAANKAVVPNANVNIGVVKATQLHIGTSGAEVQVTATPAQLNLLAGQSAGIAALLAGGIGGSASYVKTDAGTKTLLAAHATKDRASLVVVHIDQVFATGDTSQLILKIGETSTIEKCAAAATFTDAANNAVFVFAFTNTATKAIIATLTAAVGTGTGAATITVIAIPTT